MPALASFHWTLFVLLEIILHTELHSIEKATVVAVHRSLNIFSGANKISAQSKCLKRTV
jgi:hypothetical protein